MARDGDGTVVPRSEEHRGYGAHQHASIRDTFFDDAKSGDESSGRSSDLSSGRSDRPPCTHRSIAREEEERPAEAASSSSSSATGIATVLASLRKRQLPAGSPYGAYPPPVSKGDFSSADDEAVICGEKKFAGRTNGEVDAALLRAGTDASSVCCEQSGVVDIALVSEKNKKSTEPAQRQNHRDGAMLKDDNGQADAPREKDPRPSYTPANDTSRWHLPEHGERGRSFGGGVFFFESGPASNALSSGSSGSLRAHLNSDRDEQSPEEDETAAAAAPGIAAVLPASLRRPPPPPPGGSRGGLPSGADPSASNVGDVCLKVSSPACESPAAGELSGGDDDDDNINNERTIPQKDEKDIAGRANGEVVETERNVTAGRNRENLQTEQNDEESPSRSNGIASTVVLFDLAGDAGLLSTPNSPSGAGDHHPDGSGGSGLAIAFGSQNAVVGDLNVCDRGREEAHGSRSEVYCAPGQKEHPDFETKKAGLRFHSVPKGTIEKQQEEVEDKIPPCECQEPLARKAAFSGASSSATGDSGDDGQHEGDISEQNGPLNQQAALPCSSRNEADQGAKAGWIDLSRDSAPKLAIKKKQEDAERKSERSSGSKGHDPHARNEAVFSASLSVSKAVSSVGGDDGQHEGDDPEESFLLLQQTAVPCSPPKDQERGAKADRINLSREPGPKGKVEKQENDSEEKTEKTSRSANNEPHARKEAFSVASLSASTSLTADGGDDGQHEGDDPEESFSHARKLGFSGASSASTAASADAGDEGQHVGDDSEEIFSLYQRAAVPCSTHIEHGQGAKADWIAMSRDCAAKHQEDAEGSENHEPHVRKAAFSGAFSSTGTSEKQQEDTGNKSPRFEKHEPQARKAGFSGDFSSASTAVSADGRGDEQHEGDNGEERSPLHRQAAVRCSTRKEQEHGAKADWIDLCGVSVPKGTTNKQTEKAEGKTEKSLHSESYKPHARKVALSGASLSVSTLASADSEGDGLDEGGVSDKNRLRYQQAAVPCFPREEQGARKDRIDVSCGSVPKVTTVASLSVHTAASLDGDGDGQHERDDSEANGSLHHQLDQQAAVACFPQKKYGINKDWNDLSVPKETTTPTLFGTNLPTVVGSAVVDLTTLSSDEDKEVMSSSLQKKPGNMGNGLPLGRPLGYGGDGDEGVWVASSWKSEPAKPTRTLSKDPDAPTGPSRNIGSCVGNLNNVHETSAKALASSFRKLHIPEDLDTANGPGRISSNSPGNLANVQEASTQCKTPSSGQHQNESKADDVAPKTFRKPTSTRDPNGMLRGELSAGFSTFPENRIKQRKRPCTEASTPETKRSKSSAGSSEAGPTCTKGMHDEGVAARGLSYASTGSRTPNSRGVSKCRPREDCDRREHFRGEREPKSLSEVNSADNGTGRTNGSIEDRLTKQLLEKCRAEKKHRIDDGNHTGLLPGTRVYCMKPKNKRWYWGEIIQRYSCKSKNGETRGLFSYLVECDDGDVCETNSEMDVLTEAEINTSTKPKRPKGRDHEEWQSTSSSSADASSVVSSTKSTVGRSKNIEPLVQQQNNQTWWEQRCGECLNCTRAECGNCALCTSAMILDETKIEDQNTTRLARKRKAARKEWCCFQRMCRKLPTSVKAQPAPGFPPGWKFLFGIQGDSKRKRRNLVVELEMLSPRGRHFPKIEDAVSFLRSQQKSKGVEMLSEANLDELFAHVGIEKNNSSWILEAAETSGKTSAETTSNKVRNERSSSKRRAYSDRFEAGARCYAMFTNRQWYWGTITKVVRWGKYPTCSVEFDDGDKLDSVAWSDIYLEKNYRDEFNEEPPVPPLQQRNKASHDVFCNAPRTVTEKSTSVNPSEKRRTSSSKAGGATSPLCSKKCLNDSDAAGSATPSVATTSRLNLIDLHKERCKGCLMCRKEDCGKCHACVFNRCTTSLGKQTCLFKMCLQLPVIQKAQQVPGLPNGWSFYFSEPTLCEARKGDCAASKDEPWSRHPALNGLHIIKIEADDACSEGYKEYDGDIESIAVRRKLLKTQPAREMAKDFYERHLGVKLRIHHKNHPLMNKSCCHRWMGSSGAIREMFGRITDCYEDYFVKRKYWFSIEYDQDHSVAAGAIESSIRAHTLKEELSERLAWGGCLLHDKDVCLANHLPSNFAAGVAVPFHWQWIVPTRVYPATQAIATGAIAPLVLHVRGYELVLEAKKSAIPNAGLGVWAKCKALSQYLRNECSKSRRSHFELRPGEFVDLGPYTPLREEDRKAGFISVIKNYIHNWECQSWSFGVATDDRSGCCKESDKTDGQVLDVTDDWTGDLHKEARNNVVSYVNETDGIEVPSVRAVQDPEGVVHYLLGHAEEKQGPLRLPLSKETEIKIDYGPTYEKMRVRRGYSRVSKSQQEELEASMREEEADLFQEIKMFTAKEVEDSLDFLGSKPTGNWPVDKTKRALLIAILLSARLRAILQEFDGVDLSVDGDEYSFCDNGFTTLDRCRMIQLAKKLVFDLCDLIPGDDNLREALLKEELHQVMLAEVLLKCRDPNQLEKLSGRQLREMIFVYL